MGVGNTGGRPDSDRQQWLDELESMNLLEAQARVRLAINLVARRTEMAVRSSYSSTTGKTCRTCKHGQGLACTYRVFPFTPSPDDQACVCYETGLCEDGV